MDGPSLLRHLEIASENESSAPDSTASSNAPEALDMATERARLQTASRDVQEWEGRRENLVPVVDLATPDKDGGCHVPIPSSTSPYKRQRSSLATETGTTAANSAAATSGTPFTSPGDQLGGKRARVRFEQATPVSTPGTGARRSMLRTRCHPIHVDGTTGSSEARLTRWTWPELQHDMQDVLRVSSLPRSAAGSQAGAAGALGGIPYAVSPSDALSVALQALTLRCEWRAAA